MDTTVITDLKQFITITVTATVSQQLAKQTAYLDMRIDEIDQKLSTKMDDLSQSVADALDRVNDQNHAILGSHERRIVKLESRQA